MSRRIYSLIFFFNDTATTEIYTLSLHDALPISLPLPSDCRPYSSDCPYCDDPSMGYDSRADRLRSEEHTSELQSPCNLVCRLLLEKKKILRRDLLAMRHSGGQERDRAMVSALHQLRGRVGRAHQRDRRWLAREGLEAPARLGGPQRGCVH